MSTDPMAEIRASFFVECEELIEALQDALARLEAGSGDADTVHVLFRAVHSIKGGAGAFGLDALVAVAHRLESVLDTIRSGQVTVDAAGIGLLYQGADLLQDHVRAARGGGPVPEGGEAVLRALEALAVDAAPEGDRAAPPFTPLPLAFAFDPEPELQPRPATPHPGSASRLWTVTLTPGPGLYQSGNEVQHLLRALSALGRVSTRCIVPADLLLDETTAEEPRLAWEVRLQGDIDRAEIEELFDFVADVCSVTICAGIAPSAQAAAASPPPPAPSGGGLAGQRDLRLVARPDPPDDAPADRPGGEGGPVTVRVDLDKIDRLLNLVSELVINQAMLASSVAGAGMANPEVTSGLDAFAALTRDIQDGVMSVRAQPVKPLFQRMSRIVRETSASVGKAVRLRTEGEATEVDKTLIERLADPLTHMIRNAVDHGLELPEVRLASGKPREGLITLAAFHRAGRIVIEVSDDGAGIDRAKVRDRAVERALIAPDAILTEAEVDALLFLPGFTTVDRVSSLSGRGVGMDVVRSAITSLGGRIAIASERGRGTTLSISLPLTLAVLDGMVVKAGGQTFVIPLSAIVETARLVPEAVKRVGPQTELLHMRGDLIPLIDLAARLGFAGGSGRGGIVLLTAQDDGGRAALIVDAIMEQRQVVIKGLGPLFERMPGVAAATILGGGQIALILDPADLTRTTRSPGLAGQDLALAG